QQPEDQVVSGVGGHGGPPAVEGGVGRVGPPALDQQVGQREMERQIQPREQRRRRPQRRQVEGQEQQIAGREQPAITAGGRDVVSGSVEGAHARPMLHVLAQPREPGGTARILAPAPLQRSKRRTASPYSTSSSMRRKTAV